MGRWREEEENVKGGRYDHVSSFMFVILCNPLCFLIYLPFLPSHSSVLDSLEKFLEFPVLVHLRDDIASPHEFPVNIKLRYRRPFPVLFNPLPNLRVFQYVHG